jgi:hypothetical protein
MQGKTVSSIGYRVKKRKTSYGLRVSSCELRNKIARKMWVVSVGWPIVIAHSYSAGGKCEEENTEYKMRLMRTDKSEFVMTE